MLPITSHPSPRFPPHLPGSAPPSIRRRRGGQPGNSNAFRHGFYSASVPRHGSIPCRSSSKLPGSTFLPPAIKTEWIAALESMLVENRHRLAQITSITSAHVPFTEMVGCLRAATLIIDAYLRATKALHELGGRQAHLHQLVRNLPALLDGGFERLGTPSHQVFVPLKLNNSHANSDWIFPHLTDAQWLLLKDSFASLHSELDSFRKYHRRKPLPSDRFLLEGILWKLSSSLRWQDLKPNFPVRACQDLYRLLQRSGRLQAFYHQLHWHLDVFGETNLAGLVEKGCFVISGNRVLLSPSEELTWEKYTALLLLQKAFLARRTSQREADRDRRRRGIYHRLSIASLKKLRSQSRRPSTPSPLYPAEVYIPLAFAGDRRPPWPMPSALPRVAGCTGWAGAQSGAADA